MAEDWRQWWFDPKEAAKLAGVPPLTPAQYSAALRAMLTWLLIMQEQSGGAYFVPNSHEDSESALRRLYADLIHSVLLKRMLVEGKPPLPEPPPSDGVTPHYPD